MLVEAVDFLHCTKSRENGLSEAFFSALIAFKLLQHKQPIDT